MQDHPFSLQMHYIRTHYIREEGKQWGIQSMFTLKSNPVKFLLRLDSPGLMVIWHMRACVCVQYVSALCVAVNLCRFFPGGHEGRVKSDRWRWCGVVWVRSWQKHYSNDLLGFLFLSFLFSSSLPDSCTHLVAARERKRERGRGGETIHEGFPRFPSLPV